MHQILYCCPLLLMVTLWEFHSSANIWITSKPMLQPPYWFSSSPMSAKKDMPSTNDELLLKIHELLTYHLKIYCRTVSSTVSPSPFLTKGGNPANPCACGMPIKSNVVISGLHNCKLEIGLIWSRTHLFFFLAVQEIHKALLQWHISNELICFSCPLSFLLLFSR